MLALWTADRWVGVNVLLKIDCYGRINGLQSLIFIDLDSHCATPPDVTGSCLEDVRFGGFTEALKLCVVNPSASVRCSSSRLRLLILAPDVAGSALEDVTGTRAPGQFHIALCVRGSGLFCCEPSLERTRCFC
jgi:hypothetical protein